MTEMLVEPFAGYERHPTLVMWKNPKTTSVEWNQCGIAGAYECHRFTVAVGEAMNAELNEIWKRYRSQCDRRGYFSRDGVVGCMLYVPHAAGFEVMAVVRRHFIAALERLRQVINDDVKKEEKES